ncbi:MAG: OmpW family outer membrane protein [Thiolinea sp.]
MKLTTKSITAGAALASLLLSANVMAEGQSVKFGYAFIDYDNTSGDMTGPTGTTPPGVKAEAVNGGTPACYMTGKSMTTGRSSLRGLPPTTKLKAAGAAAALGEVGEAKALFPGVLGIYSFRFNDAITPYVGAGANFTRFYDTKVFDNYNTTFGGTR